MDPDTKLAMISTLPVKEEMRKYNLALPIYWTTTMLYFEPDPYFNHVTNAYIPLL